MTSNAIIDVYPTIEVIIVDVNPEIWGLRESYGEETHSQFQDVVSSLIVFCNAYLLLHRENKLCIIANNPYGAQVIYPSPEDGDKLVPAPHLLGTLLSGRLLSLVQSAKAEDATLRPSFPQALSMALCVFAEQLRQDPNIQPRLLVLQISKEQSYTYNAVMNCIFSAQKLGVQVDACMLSRRDSSFLQQACHITGGVYLCMDDQRAHLQLLMTHMLPSNYMRRVLRVHPQTTIDNKASCQCHAKPVEFAYMCSVCLALTCDGSANKCDTCGTPVRPPKARSQNLA